ncbi:unnamed protein product [Mycena citricolor]|uniref:Uncharacterized protein n=1 Tax=Mycena citricolor TaxID=2018698 RepID=A0AAD2GSK1_9AGAR|nr:unnamed protein product [Mycena citricolor]
MDSKTSPSRVVDLNNPRSRNHNPPPTHLQNSRSEISMGSANGPVLRFGGGVDESGGTKLQCVLRSDRAHVLLGEEIPLFTTLLEHRFRALSNREQGRKQRRTDPHVLC